MKPTITRDFSASVHLDIPDGYRIDRRIQTMDLEKACTLLLGKRQRKYTSAVRRDWTVELAKEVVVCPACGHEAISYDHYIVPVYCRGDTIQRQATEDDLEAWASRQMTFFKETQSLYFNQFSPPAAEYECPKCRYKSHSFTDNIPLDLIYRRHKLKVRHEITALADILSLPWIQNLQVTFPLFEELIFNFRNGHTYVQLISQTGEKLAAFDLTSQKDVKSAGAFGSFFQNTRLIRTVKKFFEWEWRSELPFSPKELDLAHLMLLTEFIGYPSSFYSAVPYVRGIYGVDPLFKKIKARLHSASVLPQIYDRSSLPGVKSVRRLLFQNPALLFYENECRLLWTLIGDVNLFCQLLKSPHPYPVLATLKLYPGILHFLEDYGQIRGRRQMLQMVISNWSRFSHYALCYISMNERTKKLEQTKWHQKQFDFGDKIEWTPFSLPMQPVDTAIRDCTIRGHHFSWLKTSNDYQRVSKELHNCLYLWDSFKNPVVCVTKNRQPVAAIEIEGDTLIIQALSFHNDPIEDEDDPSLYKAYTLWCAKYGLRERC